MSVVVAVGEPQGGGEPQQHLALVKGSPERMEVKQEGGEFQCGDVN